MSTNGLSFAIIGGGNGGQTFAAHLSILGFPVTLYDIIEETVNAINAQGGIYLQGSVNGFGRVLATTNMEAAVRSAKVIMVVTPAFAHLDVARAMLPYLEPDQVVVLNPGATFGALEVWAEFRAHGVGNTVAEAQTLLYACRAVEAGRVQVGAVKNEVDIAAIPAAKVDEVAAMLNIPFGSRFVPRESILATSLANVNAVVHPASLLMMTSRVECGEVFDFYSQGMSPSSIRIVEGVDRERICVGKAAGIDLETVSDWYRRSYEPKSESLLTLMRQNQGYQGLKAPRSLSTRYFTEDVPYGLVPLYTLGQILKVDMRLTGAVINLVSGIADKDYLWNGRRADRLGLAGAVPGQVPALVRSIS